MVAKVGQLGTRGTHFGGVLGAGVWERHQRGRMEVRVGLGHKVDSVAWRENSTCVLIVST